MKSKIQHEDFENMEMSEVELNKCIFDNENDRLQIKNNSLIEEIEKIKELNRNLCIDLKLKNNTILAIEAKIIDMMNNEDLNKILQVINP